MYKAQVKPHCHPTYSHEAAKVDDKKQFTLISMDSTSMDLANCDSFLLA